MPRVFTCYRRQDSAGWAGRIYDGLVKELGEDSVFIDVATLRPGEDFDEVIRSTIAACDAFVAVMGPTWATCTGDDGQRRLDDPGDYIRREVAEALGSDIKVVPVLVGGAKMPRARDLPPDVAPIARRHALEVGDGRFHADMRRLLRAVDPASGGWRGWVRRNGLRLAAVAAVAVLAVLGIQALTGDGNGGVRPVPAGPTGATAPVKPAPATAGGLSGEWEGSYSYPPNPARPGSGEPIPFVVVLEQRGTRLTGTVREVGKTLAGGVPPTLEELRLSLDPTRMVSSVRAVRIVEGSVRPDGSVSFVKQYEGQDGMRDRVRYVGLPSRRGRRITGSWTIVGQGVSGPFEMNR